MTCLYRRIILSLREANDSDSQVLDSKKLMGRFGLDSDKIAEGFLIKLGKEGIQTEEVDGTYAIIKDKIDEAMKRYFGIKPKEEHML